MKRKTLTLILCLLTVMSLVGVGFASWVISANDSKVTNGNIVVDTVTDNRLDLTAPQTAADLVFCGERDGYIAPTGAWLTFEGDEKVTNLKVTVACTVVLKGGNALPTNNNVVEGKTRVGVALGADFAPAENSALDKAIAQGCLTLTKDAVVEAVTLSSDMKTLTFNVVVEYGWGAAFGNKNPFDFYNELSGEAQLRKVDAKITEGDIKGTETGLTAGTSTWGDHAAYYLGLLDAVDAAGQATYSITISASMDAKDTFSTEASYSA